MTFLPANAREGLEARSRHGADRRWIVLRRRVFRDRVGHRGPRRRAYCNSHIRSEPTQTRPNQHVVPLNISIDQPNSPSFQQPPQLCKLFKLWFIRFQLSVLTQLVECCEALENAIEKLWLREIDSLGRDETFEKGADGCVRVQWG